MQSLQNSVFTRPRASWINGFAVGAMACFAIGITSEVQAQDAPESDAPSAETGTRFDEIVVTARKREELLKDVPMAISTITAEEITRQGLLYAEDYLRTMPGVNQSWQTNRQEIVIRGIGTSDASPNSRTGATAGVYFGETPTTTSGGHFGGTNVDGALVDIQRVEVLKGPQGTAFGASSLSGVVRTIPKAPNLEGFEGMVGASYSGTARNGGDTDLIQAVFNVPLVADRVAVRASGFTGTQDGYYRNVAASDPDFVASAVSFGVEHLAINKDHIGTRSSEGGRLAALFQITDDLSLTLNYLKQKVEVNGRALANYASYEQTLVQIDPTLVPIKPGRTEGMNDSDFEIRNAVLEYDFGWANLLATVSEIETEWTNFFPLGNGTTALPRAFISGTNHNEQSGEIRLVTKFDGAWNFLVGFYDEDHNGDSYVHSYWFGSEESNPFPRGPGWVGGTGLFRDQQQQATFGEVSWDFIEKFTLTVGLRAFDYDRSAKNFAIDEDFEPTSEGTLISTSEKSTTGMANLRYKISEDAMVYATWGEGFRLGRPLFPLQPDVCDLNNDGLVDGTGYPIANTGFIRSDYMDSLELGSKFSLLDQRLSFEVAVFQMVWDDLPATIQSPPPPEGCQTGPGRGIFTANVGEAESTGVEFSTKYRATSGLSINFSTAYIDAHLTTDNGDLNAFEGDPLPGSPEFSASLGLVKPFRIGSRKLSFHGNAAYVGKFRSSFPNVSDPTNGDYTMVNVSLHASFNEVVDVDLFVRNLLNEDAFANGGNRYGARFGGFQLRPRTIGVRLSYNF